MRAKKTMRKAVILLLVITFLPLYTALAEGNVSKRTDEIFNQTFGQFLPKPNVNSKANLTILVQNNATRPLAPSVQSNSSTPSQVFSTGYTYNPGVDAFKEGAVTSVPRAVSSVGTRSSVVAPTDLNATNPASLTDRTNLMGAYLNNGRRKSDPTVYNPKYDTRIDSNSSAFTNQINPASLNNKKGVLYHNDGTQYGYRSARDPEYVSANSNNPSVVAAASNNPRNQINSKSLNRPMGPYYNDGTRYSDRSIKNPVYDIYNDHK